jgi:hypothetical protein
LLTASSRGGMPNVENILIPVMLVLMVLFFLVNIYLLGKFRSEVHHLAL